MSEGMSALTIAGLVLTYAIVGTYLGALSVRFWWNGEEWLDEQENLTLLWIAMGIAWPLGWSAWIAGKIALLAFAPAFRAAYRLGRGRETWARRESG